MNINIDGKISPTIMFGTPLLIGCLIFLYTRSLFLLVWGCRGKWFIFGIDVYVVQLIISLVPFVAISCIAEGLQRNMLARKHVIMTLLLMLIPTTLFNLSIFMVDARPIFSAKVEYLREASFALLLSILNPAIILVGLFLGLLFSGVLFKKKDHADLP